jgi:hypothetical protein
MIPGHPRSAADRPRRTAPPRDEPRLDGHWIAFAILLSMLLWALVVLAVIHLVARILP